MKIKVKMIQVKEFWQEIEAEPLPNNFGLELYVSKNEPNCQGDSWYKITEGTTGKSIGGGWSTEMALAEVELHLPEIKEYLRVKACQDKLDSAHNETILNKHIYNMVLERG